MSMSEAAPGGRRMRMAADLFRFAVTSLLAGLFAAIAFAALAVLLAQPSYAASAGDTLTLRARAPQSCAAARGVETMMARFEAREDYPAARPDRRRCGKVIYRLVFYFARPRSTNTAFISA
jgi:hypothetical protein